MRRLILIPDTPYVLTSYTGKEDKYYELQNCVTFKHEKWLFFKYENVLFSKTRNISLLHTKMLQFSHVKMYRFQIQKISLFQIWKRAVLKYKKCDLYVLSNMNFTYFWTKWYVIAKVVSLKITYFIFNVDLNLE